MMMVPRLIFFLVTFASVLRAQEFHGNDNALIPALHALDKGYKNYKNNYSRRVNHIRQVLLTVLSFVNPPPPNQAALQQQQQQQQYYNNFNPYNNHNNHNPNNAQVVYIPPPNPNQYNNPYYYHQGYDPDNNDNKPRSRLWWAFTHTQNRILGMVFGLLWRGTKIAGSSFLLSELLAHWGVFGEHEAAVNNAASLNNHFHLTAKRIIRRLEHWKSQIQLTWDDFRRKYLNEKVVVNAMSCLRKKVSDFPSEVLVPGIKSYRVLPNKTKFATGTSLGMLWSRIMLRVSWKMTKLCGLVYIAHELLHYFNVIGNDDAYLNQIWMANVQAEQKQSIIQGVEFVRRQIAEIIDTASYKMQVFIAALIEEETPTAVGMVAGTMLGFVV